MAKSNYEQWFEVCDAYSKSIDAELLFVNCDSFGILTKSGELWHIYDDELYQILELGITL